MKMSKSMARKIVITAAFVFFGIGASLAGQTLSGTRAVTVPSKVSHPFDTLTLMRSFGTVIVHSSRFTAARAMSSSVRSLENGSRISSSLATALTPATRAAASAAAIFSQ